MHEGHRSRMMQRFNAAPAAASDHEILEILLYFSIRRGDTNEIAHRLLRTCGSLKNVLEADDALLLSVKGVGRASVAAIKTVAELTKRCYGAPAVKEKFVYYDYKQKLIKFYDGMGTETFIIFMLDANECVISRFDYEGAEDNVKLDVAEIAKQVAIIKPTYAVIAHNHPSGDKCPSAKDDETTVRIAELMNMHGVKLLDHIIVADKDVFSYHYGGKMEIINKEITDRKRRKIL